MKEFNNVKKVVHTKDAVHIILENGESETFVDIESLQTIGEKSINISQNQSEILFKNAKCIVVETNIGKKIIECYEESSKEN